MTNYAITTDTIGSGHQFEFPAEGDTLTVTANALVHSSDTSAIFGALSDQVLAIDGIVNSGGNITVAMGAGGPSTHANSVAVRDGGLLRNSYTDGFAATMYSYQSSVGNEGEIRSANSGVIFFGDHAGTVSTFTNFGVVDVGYRAVTHAGSEGVFFVNRGSVESETAFIDTYGSFDSIDNGGSIVGNILLGGGADIYWGAGGRLRGQVYGGDGNDKITMGFENDRTWGGANNDTIAGGGGNDELLGEADSDTLGGGLGNDSLYGGEGADYLSGGTGSDAASYLLAVAAVGQQGVVASLANPTINTGEAAGDTYNSIENLIGSKYADTLNGNNGVNVVRGGGGDDKIKGYGGADRLYGDDGADILSGGAGGDFLSGGLSVADTATYEQATGGVVASLANPAINTGEAAGDIYSSVEYLTGSAHNDTLYGDNGDNIVIANGGADVLKGYLGNDILRGGSGRDTFIFNTTPNSDTNVESLRDFVSVDDVMWLDRSIFVAAGQAGTLAAAAFQVGPAAADLSDRIIYNPETHAVSYDADGSGGGASVIFAVTAGAPTSADFVIF